MMRNQAGMAWHGVIKMQEWYHALHSHPHLRIHTHDFLTPTPKPSDLRKVIWQKTRVRPQGELPQRPDSMYVDPIDKYLYDELREEEDKKTIKEGMDGLYEPMEDKETVV